MRALGVGLALVTTVAACGGDDGDPPTGTAAVDVLAYAYEIDLETRAASIRLVVNALSPGNCIALPSRSAALDLSSVRLGTGDIDTDNPLAVAAWDGAT